MTGKEFSTQVKFVVNCAGPWVKNVDQLLGVENNVQVKFSRGTHLLFSTKWKSPSLFLPMEGQARYYFVWKHPGGTMVGTTEREVEEIEENPQASDGEIEEILARLERDLPQENLNRSTLYQSFAGLRTLPIRSNNSKTGSISRRHIWELKNNNLSLYGGKFTSAAWTAFEGLKLIAKDLRPGITLVQGRENLNLGLPALDKSLEIAIKHCLEKEYIKTLDDLITRRLGLSYLPNLGGYTKKEIEGIVKRISSADKTIF